MKPFRCSNCNKLLGKIEGKAEIVCPRCKTKNEINNLHEHVANAMQLAYQNGYNDAIKFAKNLIKNYKKEAPEAH